VLWCRRGGGASVLRISRVMLGYEPPHLAAAANLAVRNQADSVTQFGCSGSYESRTRETSLAPPHFGVGAECGPDARGEGERVRSDLPLIPRAPRQLMCGCVRLPERWVGVLSGHRHTSAMNVI
jgi:hypothetical protein